eukprot:scpid112203/ scgid28497/ 
MLTNSVSKPANDCTIVYISFCTQRLQIIFVKSLELKMFSLTLLVLQYVMGIVQQGERRELRGDSEFSATNCSHQGSSLCAIAVLCMLVTGRVVFVPMMFLCHAATFPPTTE